MSENPFDYSEQVWRLFSETPRSGDLEGPQVVAGTAETRANNSQLRLTARLAAGRVEDARFRAYGCPTAIAVGAWLAGWLIGRRVEELSIRVADIRQALEIPEDRLHCALLGEDAIKSLQAAAR